MVTRYPVAAGGKIAVELKLEVSHNVAICPFFSQSLEVAIMINHLAQIYFSIPSSLAVSPLSLKDV